MELALQDLPISISDPKLDAPILDAHILTKVKPDKGLCFLGQLVASDLKCSKGMPSLKLQSPNELIVPTWN